MKLETDTNGFDFVKFKFQMAFSFQMQFICSGKVYMSGTKLLQNSVGTVYPFRL